MKAARCDKDGEVFIFIDKHDYKPYAGDTEHVPDKVNFFAASRCTLYFDENTPVFKDDTYALNEGENWLTPSRPGSTQYAINHRPQKAEKPERPAGPILVVP